MMESHSQSPVSHMITVTKLPNKGLSVQADADEKQRRSLADEHGLQAVDRFSYNLHLSPWKGRGVRVRGDVSAVITQPCTVTLEPVQTEIKEQVETLLVPDDSRLARPQIVDGEMVVSAEGDDLPETFSNGKIDVGALAEEFFELAIPLYPRSDGAELPEGIEDQPGDAGADNPFAVLSTLKPH